MKGFSENAVNYLGSLQEWLLPSNQLDNQSTSQLKAKLKPISIFTYFQNVQEVSFIMQGGSNWGDPQGNCMKFSQINNIVF